MHNQEIVLKDTKKASVRLFIKREDLIHPFISGNKFRKLKYNISEAEKLKHHTLLTFGGAFSNHIAATAYAGFENGLKTIGVIRGEELADKTEKNATLSFAEKHGMIFKYVSRSDYREKEDPIFTNKLKEEFGDFFLVPEGGTNNLAVKGCEEILEGEDFNFDYICTAVGTGGTISGLINCSQVRQQVLGFPALKGNFLQTEIRKFANQDNWDLQTDYHFGGYAKINQELIHFINEFKDETGIPLDPVYTGKMMFGILNLIKEGYFKEHTKILAIHTGGLQGISGMNERLKQKNLPLIK
ncbi:1-aminocyclopropane-1-carboxylate deaminase/D-cysteine desulfhydrase [Joostella atrarenae]|uniref:1-aminocyclopropane-1-carboxylate deaminase/D-cysteine desulfhydrase n=1 Tax=Joostella atrarenae TaxID=679257 RepID=A0ABS9J0P2_9FLAO|nr:pyridoxal-phosphate dependent enzyme [Joostella atrarenae]MCF8714009.1 1-aminocyclopropane-1-carboxylate deaminase/D-cysteine desulfhydrase [Joostella atrarenae]